MARIYKKPCYGRTIYSSNYSHASRRLAWIEIYGRKGFGREKEEKGDKAISYPCVRSFGQALSGDLSFFLNPFFYQFGYFLDETRTQEKPEKGKRRALGLWACVGGERGGGGWLVV